MRIARFRDRVPRRKIQMRNPRTNPVYGDVLEDQDGERRSVEIRERDDSDHVHYRRAGAHLPVTHAPALLRCGILEWQSWARDADVLHAAHKPAEPPASKRARRRGHVRAKLPAVARRKRE